MWTEHAPPNLVDNRVFPRLIAFSQVMWSPDTKGDFPKFLDLTEKHLGWLDFMGVKEKIDPANKIPIPGYVFSSLYSYESHVYSNAFDGDPNTYFQAAGSLEEYDHVTLVLRDFRMIEEIQVLTGAPANNADGVRDALKSGILEISFDGLRFKQVSTFNKQGIAIYQARNQDGQREPSLVKAVRIRSHKNPNYGWLIVREFILK